MQMYSILVRHSRFSCRYIACIQLHFVLFNLENSKILNRIIQIQELTFCIYNSLGKLGHTLKQNIMEIDISSWKQDYKEYREIEIDTDTERESYCFSSSRPSHCLSVNKQPKYQQRLSCGVEDNCLLKWSHCNVPFSLSFLFPLCLWI